MQDLLLFYYNETGIPVPDKFEKIVELCKINSNLFDTAFILQKEFEKCRNEYYAAHELYKVENENMGILLSGIGLYFYNIKDTYNSSRLFELALPSRNIVAFVLFHNITLTNALFIDKFNQMKRKCEDMIYPFLNSTSCFTCVQKILLDKIMQQKTVIHDSIKEKNDKYEAFTDIWNKTTATLKNAIDLSTCTLYFDIETFFNIEEFL